MSLRCRSIRGVGPSPLVLFALALVPATWVGGETLILTKNLVPATWSAKVDAAGFSWDINQYGAIAKGTNVFNSANVLLIGGSQFSGQQRQMSRDGQEYVISGVHKNVKVTRQIRLDAKSAVVRYIDSFHNPGSASMSIVAMVRTQLNSSTQWRVTDQGRPLAGALAKSEYGLAFGQPSNGRPAVLVVVGGPGGKIKPSVTNYSNYRFDFNYPLTIPAGKTVSIMHVIAQRNLAAVPAGKGLKDVFKPLKSVRLRKGMPLGLARTVVNFSFRGGLADSPSPLQTISEVLGVEPENTDVLVIGEDTRLKGSASASEPLKVQTRFGSTDVDLATVAALTGSKFGGRRHRVYLRDGQILVGQVDATGLKFVTQSRQDVPLTLASLDRLVLQRRPDDGRVGPDIEGFVETLGGHRLAMQRDSSLALSFATPWGELELARSEVELVRPAEDQQPGQLIRLRDGSQFFGFMRGGGMDLKTLIFGDQKLLPAEIRSFSDVRVVRANGDEDEPELSLPTVTLVGENTLTGRIDAAELHFLTLGHLIPIKPALIRQLTSLDDEDELEDAGFVSFQAELWDGGTVTGRLKEAVLPIRISGHVFHVPARDILEATSPSPIIPDAVRTEIARLIRQLGSVQWNQREQATTKLEEYGLLARPQLEQVLRQTQDPEVRRRVQTLLDGIES
ncbi:MAG: hypothetical protein OER86_06065 [Phycisphaerae bacterium]|nr:hypothetical protein [Phycisphaerae bacterium]